MRNCTCNCTCIIDNVYTRQLLINDMPLHDMNITQYDKR